MFRFGALTFRGPRDHLREHFRTAREDVPRLRCPTNDFTDEYLVSGHDREPCQLDSVRLSDDPFVAALQLAREASQFSGQPAKSKRHLSSKLCSKEDVQAVMSSVQPKPAFGPVACSNKLTHNFYPGLAEVTFGLQLQWRKFANSLFVPLLEKRISYEPQSLLLEFRPELTTSSVGPVTCPQFSADRGEAGRVADQQLVNVSEGLNRGFVPPDVSMTELFNFVSLEAESKFGKVQPLKPEPMGIAEALAQAIEPKPVPRDFGAAAASGDAPTRSEFRRPAAPHAAARTLGLAEATSGSSRRTLACPFKNAATPARGPCASLPPSLIENLLQYHGRQHQHQHQHHSFSDIQLEPNDEFLVSQAASQGRSRCRHAEVSPVMLGCPPIRRLSPGRIAVPELWHLRLAPAEFEDVQRVSEVEGSFDEDLYTHADAIVVAEKGRRHQGQGRGHRLELASPVAAECCGVDAMMAREAAAAVEALVGLGNSLNAELDPTELDPVEPAPLLAPIRCAAGCGEGSVAEVSRGSHVSPSKDAPQQHYHHHHNHAADSALILSSSAIMDFLQQLQLNPEPLTRPLQQLPITSTSATPSHLETPSRGSEHRSLGLDLPADGVGRRVGAFFDTGEAATAAVLPATRAVNPLVTQLLHDVRRVIRSDPGSRLAAATGATAPAARIARVHDDALLAGPVRYSALMAAAMTMAAWAASCRASAGIAGIGAEPGRNDAGDFRNGDHAAESAPEGGDDIVPGNVGKFFKNSQSCGGCAKASCTDTMTMATAMATTMTTAMTMTMQPRPLPRPRPRLPEAFLLELPIQLPCDELPVVQTIMRAIGKSVHCGVKSRWQALVAAAPPPPSLPLPTAYSVQSIAAGNGSNAARIRGSVTDEVGGGRNDREAVETRRRQPACVEDLIAADLQLQDESGANFHGFGGGVGVGVRTLPVVLQPSYAKDVGDAGISGGGPTSWAESAPDVLRSAMADLGCTGTATAHLDLYLDWSVLGSAGPSRMASGAMIGARYGGRGGGSSSGSAAAFLLRTALYPKQVTLASTQHCSAMHTGHRSLSASASASASVQRQRLGSASDPGFAFITGHCWVQYAGCLACTADCVLWPGTAALLSLRRWQRRLLPLNPDGTVRVVLHQGAADGCEAQEEKPKNAPGSLVSVTELHGSRPLQDCSDKTGGGGRDRKTLDFTAAAAAAAVVAPARCDVAAPGGARNIEVTDAGDGAACRSRAGTGGCGLGDAVKRPRSHRADDSDVGTGREGPRLTRRAEAPASGGDASSSSRDADVLSNSEEGSLAVARPFTKRRRTETARPPNWDKLPALAAEATVPSAVESPANKWTKAAVAEVPVRTAAARAAGANTASKDGSGTAPLLPQPQPQLQTEARTVPQPPASATLRPPSATNPNSIASSGGSGSGSGGNALPRLQQIQRQGAAELQFFMQLHVASNNDRGQLDAAAAAVTPLPRPNEQSVERAERHTVPLELGERHLTLLAGLNAAHKDLVDAATAALAAAAKPATRVAITGHGELSGDGDEEAVAEAAAEARVLQAGIWEVEPMERLIASHQARHRSTQQQQQQHHKRGGGQHVVIAPARKALLQQYVAIMGLRQAAVALLHYGIRAAHMSLSLLVRQLAPVAKLCGGAAEVLEEVSKQVEEQLAGPATAAATATAAASPAAFEFGPDAAAGADTDERVPDPLVDHPAVGAVHRLLTVLDATNPDPRVLIVTDPRVFFVLYPAVQASGLRPAHLPAAVMKALSVEPPLAAPVGSRSTVAVTAASSAGSGDKAGGSGCEAQADNLQAAMIREVMALAQRGTCLFVGHRLAACSAAFPLSHFDALLILVPDRPGAWGGGGGAPPNSSAPGGGSLRGGGVVGSDATACDGWAGVPARLRECAVERHLIFTRRPSDASLAALVISQRGHRRSEMEKSSQAAVHCTEQPREQPRHGTQRPQTSQLQPPRSPSRPPSLQPPGLLQTRLTQEGVGDGGRSGVEEGLQGRSVSLPGAEPSSGGLGSVPMTAPARSQLQQIQQQSVALPLQRPAQMKGPERQQQQHEGSQDVYAPQGHRLHQQPRRQHGTQVSEMSISQQPELLCRIPRSEQTIGENAAAREPHNRQQQQQQQQRELQQQQQPLLSMREVPLPGAAAVASASAAGCSVAASHPGDGERAGRWPVIFSSAPGSVLRTRASLSDQLLKRCEVTHNTEVWWRLLEDADIILSPVACVAVWPFTRPPPPPVQQGHSSGSSQLPATMSHEEELGLAERLLPVMLDRVVQLSMRYSRATVVFEAPAGLGAALLRRSAPLQAAAMKAGLRVMLLTTVGQMATQNTVLSVVDASLQHDPSCRFSADDNGGGSSNHSTDKRLQLPYAPLDDEPTAAEVLLCKTPCLNPLSAAALLGTGLPLGNLLNLIIAAAAALTGEKADRPADAVGGATPRLWVVNTVDRLAGAATGNGGNGNGAISRATERAYRDGDEVNAVWRVCQAMQYMPLTCVPLLSAHLVAAKQEHHRRRQQRQQEQQDKQQQCIHAHQWQQRQSPAQQQGMMPGKAQQLQHQPPAPPLQQEQRPTSRPLPQQPPPPAREPQLTMQHMGQVGMKRQRLGSSTAACRPPAACEGSPWARAGASERDCLDWPLPEGELVERTLKSGHEPQARQQHHQHEQLQSSRQNPYHQQQEQTMHQPGQHTTVIGQYDGHRAQQPTLYDCSRQHLQQQPYEQCQDQRERLPNYAEGYAGGESQLPRSRIQSQPPHSYDAEVEPDLNLLDIGADDELCCTSPAEQAPTSAGTQQALINGPFSYARRSIETLQHSGMHSPAQADRITSIIGVVQPSRGAAHAAPPPGYVKHGIYNIGKDPALELSVEEDNEAAAVRPSASSLMMLRNPLSYMPKGPFESMKNRVGSCDGGDRRCFYLGFPDPGAELDMNKDLDPDGGRDIADFCARPGVTPMPGAAGTAAGNAVSALGGHEMQPYPPLTNGRPLHGLSTGALEAAQLGYVDRSSLDAECLLDTFLAQRLTHAHAVAATGTSRRKRPHPATGNADMVATGVGGKGVLTKFAMSGSSGGGDGATAIVAASGPSSASSAAAQGRAAGGWQKGPAVLGRPGSASVGGRKVGRGVWGDHTVGAGRGRRYNQR